jgi:hypothetical protein
MVVTVYKNMIQGDDDDNDGNVDDSDGDDDDNICDGDDFSGIDDNDDEDNA